MGKKKWRIIHVDGQPFKWSISPINDNPNYVTLRLWKGDSKQLWRQVELRFDNPWLHFGEIHTVAAKNPDKLNTLYQLQPVTPEQVASWIRNFLKEEANRDEKTV